MKVILASASPRRIELMKRLFNDFEVIPAKGEEQSKESEPDKYVIDLASAKASEIEKENITAGDDEYVIVGADTVVALNGKILGKPKNAKEAKHMIEMLQGNVHQVYTGVSLVLSDLTCRRNIGFAEKTEVYFNPMTKEEIDEYISFVDENGNYEWADKAGAYAIQGYCSKFIKKIDGDFYNVVGFPVAEIYRRIKM